MKKLLISIAIIATVLVNLSCAGKPTLIKTPGLVGYDYIVVNNPIAAKSLDTTSSKVGVPKEQTCVFVKVDEKNRPVSKVMCFAKDNTIKHTYSNVSTEIMPSLSSHSSYTNLIGISFAPGEGMGSHIVTAYCNGACIKEEKK